MSEISETFGCFAKRVSLRKPHNRLQKEVWTDYLSTARVKYEMWLTINALSISQHPVDAQNLIMQTLFYCRKAFVTENIKVVIGNVVASEGLDLKNIRLVSVLSTELFELQDKEYQEHDNVGGLFYRNGFC